MARNHEIIFELVPQEWVEYKTKSGHETFAISFPDEYKPPKDLVFREDASLLTQTQQVTMEGVIEGYQTKQIANQRNLAHQTVKHHVRNAAKRLRGSGYDIPKDSPSEFKINIILALLHSGDLELRDSV